MTFKEGTPPDSLSFSPSSAKWSHWNLTLPYLWCPGSLASFRRAEYFDEVLRHWCVCRAERWCGAAPWPARDVHSFTAFSSWCRSMFFSPTSSHFVVRLQLQYCVYTEPVDHGIDLDGIDLGLLGCQGFLTGWFSYWIFGAILEVRIRI